MVQMNHPFLEFEREEIEQSIPNRFEQQVRAYPDRPAIKTSTCQVTYAELNHLSNRVAHAVLLHTDRRNVRTVLLLEQDSPLIVAFLGVLKAGCTCIPIDTNFPPARIDSMVEDSQPEIIITNNQNLEIVHRLSQKIPLLINLDRLDPQPSAENPQLPIAPEDLSFLVYTSGTTGEPKGIMQTHRNALRNARAYINGFHISPVDRIPLLASLGTGQGIVTTFNTLLSGSTLYPYNIREKGLDGLTAFLIEERITVLIAASTVFRQFVRTLTGNEEFQDLRLIRLGSEPVIGKDFELYLKHFAEHSVLVNALSATEVGNFTQYIMDKNTEITGNIVPVGLPVEFMEVMLLDDKSEEVESNSVGEIAIRSRYLSPGYWRKPDLSKEVFRSVPGSDERVYFTGDLGRRHPDGRLEHLGRKDSQAKIRGFRIEVEEIEARLNQHVAVLTAAVCIPKKEEKRLIAYIVPQQGHNPTVRQLVDHLQEGLPEYMIPSEFRIVDALPMAPSGKVDRNALTSLPETRAALGQNYIPPRDSVEEKLVEIWSEILQHKPIGIEDRFFELGGHSLSTTQVISRIRSHFGAEISFREFFDEPTITNLARRIRQKIERKIPPIETISRNQEVPLSFSQQRLFFLYKLEPEGSRYNIARAYRLLGSLNATVLEQALTELLRRHESLRTVFPSKNGIPRQWITAPTPVKIKTIDLADLESHERESQALQLLQEEASCPFDLEQGPVFRPAIVRLGKNDHIFLIAMHHITTDVWSRQTLLKELSILYHSCLNGHSSKLPELRVQYADYAVWQRQFLRGELLENLASYWKKKLNGLCELELPTDRPRPPVLSFRGKTQTCLLPLALQNQLQLLSETEGVTVFMALLAAFQCLLHSLSGQEDIAVGIPIANRNFLEIENVIGFFVNTLVLRCDLSGDPSFRTLLSRVRETTLEAFAYQDLPFEKLVEKLNPKRGINRTPFFQAMFAFENMPAEPFELPGLVVTPLQLENETAMFDLSLTIFEKKKGLQTSWKYSTDLFDDSTITRWMTVFGSMLEKVIANPDRSLSQFSGLQ